MQKHMFRKEFVFAIIMLFVGASVLPSIITNVIAKHEDKPLIRLHKNIAIYLGGVAIYSDGIKRDSYADAFKYNIPYNQINISKDGEMITFEFLIHVLIPPACHSQGTANISVGTLNRKETCTDGGWIENVTWNFDVWCEEGDFVNYTISAVVYDPHFTLSDTKSGTITCPSSVSTYKSELKPILTKLNNLGNNLLSQLIYRLFEPKLKVGDNTNNKAEHQRILLQNSIKCI
jgi:hypothetical protein